MFMPYHHKKYVSVTIATDVSNGTMVGISENEADLTGVTVEEQTIRKYNMTNILLLLSIIGTISDAQLEEYKNRAKFIFTQK